MTRRSRQTRYASLLERIRAWCRLEAPPPGFEKPCRIFEGYVHSNGYGSITVRVSGIKRPRLKRVHRLVYEKAVGPIPEGWEVDHKCERRLCCEETHLQAVLPEVNNKLRWSRARAAEATA